MITIDWVLFILMLAGTASLSAALGLLFGCCIRSGRDKNSKERHRR